MSKKHYVALAKALAEVRPTPPWRIVRTPQGMTWKACVTAVSDVCDDNNRKFDRMRFWDACHQ